MGTSERNLTPRRIVEELDKYIVGQMEAKKAVAIAIRNRLRRQQLGDELREDVVPKNLILIGPTGVGKTEIARRIANLCDAPFVKVEASKFTEVGYVGRDVESMVRDLVDASVNLVRQQQLREVEKKAESRVEDRLLDLLIPPPPGRPGFQRDPEEDAPPAADTREKFRAMLREGKLEDREVEVQLETRPQHPSFDIFTSQGVEQMGMDFQSLFERIAPARKQERKLAVREARKALLREESEKMIDRDKVNQEAVRRAETAGIIFLDEIDKICSREGAQGAGPDVSREGVQRDLLPIVEGSTVNTRYGVVRTDHILFIAAGAFHVAKPSDLIPELQGRFPIRVELGPLGRADFLRILREPRNALTKQYAALLATDGVRVEFADDALEEIARIAEDVNTRTQNIGARRLHTIVEKLLEDPLFDAPDYLRGELRVDREFVRRKLAKVVEDEDLSRYIL
jgi:ATP-dependent HslUV protease ATP-binding subunit HslU